MDEKSKQEIKVNRFLYHFCICIVDKYVGVESYGLRAAAVAAGVLNINVTLTEDTI